RSPKAGKQMQKPQPPVKGVSYHTNEQSRQKQRNRRQGDKNQKTNADNAIKHRKPFCFRLFPCQDGAEYRQKIQTCQSHSITGSKA
ncbi:MAG TPA: hypothetical protein PLZ82_08230, partial [Smithellaceae bacterium]|nr:hypothetical protein [Smithellaceae bacterium]